MMDLPCVGFACSPISTTVRY